MVTDTIQRGPCPREQSGSIILKIEKKCLKLHFHYHTFGTNCIGYCLRWQYPTEIERLCPLLSHKFSRQDWQPSWKIQFSLLSIFAVLPPGAVLSWSWNRWNCPISPFFCTMAKVFQERFFFFFSEVLSQLKTVSESYRPLAPGTL